MEASLLSKSQLGARKMDKVVAQAEAGESGGGSTPKNSLRDAVHKSSFAHMVRKRKTEIKETIVALLMQQ